MTENEAIEYIKNMAFMCEKHEKCEYGNQCTTKCLKATKMAIKSLEEIQQYRAIGTIEEFKALKEKNTPKKIKYECYCGFKDSICPVCERGIDNEDKYCKRCGQKLDWQ